MVVRWIAITGAIQQVIFAYYSFIFSIFLNIGEPNGYGGSQFFIRENCVASYKVDYFKQIENL